MPVLTSLDLGSWADEMDDLPLPGKSHLPGGSSNICVLTF